MKTKKQHIVRYTAEALAAMEARGESRTDWIRAARMPVPDGTDPDDAIGTVPIGLATAKLPLPVRTEAATLRLDADVLDWFRAQGHGYETRINAVLRHYVKQHLR